jgi:erythromycin esterase
MKLRSLMTLALLIFACDNDEDAASTPLNLNAVSVTLVNEASLDTLINVISNDRYVLLGEASHGTSEFYEWRAAISKQLIQQNEFKIIAVEGDWPDLFRLNEYINGSTEHGNTATEVLRKLNRWPTWMWANEEVAAFAEWLKNYNSTLSAEQRVHFYGLDVYSLWDSLNEILSYLNGKDPSSADAAEKAIDCFAPFASQDEFAYAEAKLSGGTDCADELEALLSIVENTATDDGAEATLNAIQNARIALNAERYYVAALQSNASSWNIRDEHMMETIERIEDHYGSDAGIIVWAHNTHVGDARATTMAEQGMVNLGQLVREAKGEENVYVTGFGTYTGYVIAASSWGNATMSMSVPHARTGSWESILHQASASDRIIFVDALKNNDSYNKKIGHRAIGVVYNPSSEQGNYVPSIIPERYNAFIFLDETTALKPLSSISTGRVRQRQNIMDRMND